MKTKLIIALAGCQILALAWVAVHREGILHAGQTIYFRTAPIDPRDAFRGDYVRLSYEMSRVPKALCRGKLVDFEKLPADTVVYAALEVGQDKVAKLTALALEPPSSGPFLRGRTERAGNGLRVRYGLEAFFVEQGKGLELEQGRNREGIQVPLEMQTAVSAGGLAVLKDYRWCPLGMGVTVETKAVTRPNGQPQRQAVAAKVRLLNASSNVLAIVDLPEGRSLALVPDHSWMENPWRWVPPQETPPAPGPAHVLVLQPGQVHEMRLALDDPYWSVSKQDKRDSHKPLAQANFNQDWSRFRFEYRPPAESACAHLTNANLIWHGTLLSPTFNPTGNVD